MKQLAAAVCLMFAMAPVALAQDKDAEKKAPSVAQKAQQERMKGCNDRAGDKGLKGDERKTFMSACLKGQEPAAAAKPSTQQDKMKTCNKNAGDKGLKGDERKAFMSNCLKG